MISLQIYELMAWIVLGILFGVLFYFVHKKFQENNVWEYAVKKYRDNIDKKIDKEADFVSKFGSMENKSIFYKFDRLVLTSGIKRYLP